MSKPCRVCSGSGTVPDAALRVWCKTCGGTGLVERDEDDLKNEILLLRSIIARKHRSFLSSSGETWCVQCAMPWPCEEMRIITET